MYSPRLVQSLNQVAYKHQPLFRKAIVDVLSQPRYTNTGIAAGSVEVEVVEGNASTSPQLNITFADHLIMLNKTKMQWTRLPNIGKLLEWAETKKDDPKQAKRLAWAVAWNQRKNDTWRAKTWRKKSLSGVLKEMNEEMLKEFDAAIQGDLDEAVKK